MLQEIERRAAALVAAGQEPRKHHLVPRFYLERWSEDSKIRMTDLSTRDTFTPSPLKAARRTDFYRSEEGTYKWGTAVHWEVFLSVLEGRVSGFTSQLIDDGIPFHELPIEGQGEIIWYVALQITRGVTFRRNLQWTYLQEHVMLHDLSGDDALRRRLERGGFEVSDESLATVRDQLEQMKSDPMKLPMLTALKVKHSATAAAELVPWLAGRRMVVYRTPPRLVTSDEPVTPLDVDLGADSATFGVANAPVLVLPLAPSVVLAMFRPDFPVKLSPDVELSVEDTLDLNQAVLGNAYRYGFERPSMTMTTRLRVPDLPEAGERRIVGRGPNGEEIHKLTPGRRWRNQPGAPVRPVARWW